jgi:hypothetical protein
LEIIDRFRNMAHSDGYRVEHCWLSLSDNKHEVEDFLAISQKNTKPSESRILRSDLEHVVAEYTATLAGSLDADFIHKIALQKSNTAIYFKSTGSGFWTHLAFLYGRAYSGSINWYLYAYARGRFKSISLNPEIRKESGIRLAYTSFLAINERKHMQFRELV